MSILTVADLKARCIVDPVTHCWHWQGARAGGKKSTGLPAIHTFDHARGEKRTMSGPVAAWNIAHQAAPNAPLVFRACQCGDCLNPAHLKLARSCAEIGLHQRRAGSRKGKNVEQRRANLAKGRAAQGIVETPVEIVLAIQTAPSGITGRELARIHGLSESTTSKIRLGRTRGSVETGRAWGQGG